jgi:O-antigen/teichoic acid export membrane protein
MINKFNIQKNENSSNNCYSSVNEVAKGTFIIFFGTIIGLLFTSLGRIIFARIFSSSEYGIFSLGIGIINIASIIGALGLREGLTRQIAYNEAKKQVIKIKYFINLSFILTSLMGIVLFIFLFFSSEFISDNIFKIPSLKFPLQILSIAIPFEIMIFILASIFRGFRRVREKVIFFDIIRNITFPFLLLIVFVQDNSFIFGVVMYVISIIITCNLFFTFYILKNPLSSPLKIILFKTAIGKELLLFSIPLLLVSILYEILHWTDTLMIGYFLMPDKIGFYNAANPLGHLISSALAAMLFIYTPVVTNLFAKNKIHEMRASYAVLTKWLCVVTFPLALIFILYPKIVIQFLFGSDYVLASTSLQILSIGFFLNNLFGPNGATLTAIGKTKFLMIATLTAAIINIFLNFILIPIWDINGAAIATISSLVCINLVRSGKLYSISKTHSLTKNNLKPLILTSVVIVIIWFLTNRLLMIKAWMLPIVFIIFLVIYINSIIITKSIDNSDIYLLSNVEKRIGINLYLFKKFIKKFNRIE